MAFVVVGQKDWHRINKAGVVDKLPDLPVMVIPGCRAISLVSKFGKESDVGLINEIRQLFSNRSSDQEDDMADVVVQGERGELTFNGMPIFVLHEQRYARTDTRGRRQGLRSYTVMVAYDMDSGKGLYTLAVCSLKDIYSKAVARETCIERFNSGVVCSFQAVPGARFWKDIEFIEALEAAAETPTDTESFHYNLRIELAGEVLELARLIATSATVRMPRIAKVKASQPVRVKRTKEEWEAMKAVSQ